MSSFLTQCPHCLTPFRVTDKQLDAAEGRVRCGACLGIFSAEANRIKVKPSPDELAAAEARAHDEVEDDADADALVVNEVDDGDLPEEADDDIDTPTLRDYDIPLGDLNLDLDADDDQDDAEEHAYAADDLDEPEDVDEYEAAELGEPEDVDEYEAAEVDDLDDIAEHESDIPEDDDELDDALDISDSHTEEATQGTRLIDIVYEEYLDEDDDDAEPVETSEAEPEPEPSEEFEPEFIFEDEELGEEFLARAVEDADDDAFEEDHDTLEAPDDAGDDASVEEPDIDAIVALEDEEEFEAVEEYDDDDYEEDEDERFAATPPLYSRTVDARARPDDKAALHDYLADIEDDDALDPLDDDDALAAIDEPVLLEAAPRRNRLAGLALLLANLLLVGLLTWQYADENVERLSRSASLAPVLPYLCRVVDCPEPQRTQPDLFVSEQLLVRSHPRYAQALEVNLVFRNDAPEAQPFPALELGFHDPSNRMVANRLFQPAEYLPPELQAAEMPAQSSIQVTLELVDPGSDAVNYTLGFRAP